MSNSLQEHNICDGKALLISNKSTPCVSLSQCKIIYIATLTLNVATIGALDFIALL